MSTPCSDDSQDELQENPERGRHGDSGDAVRSGSQVASHDAGGNSRCRRKETGICLQCGSTHGQGGRCAQGCSDHGVSDESRNSRVDEDIIGECRPDDFRANAVNEEKLESGHDEQLILDGLEASSMNRKTRRKLRKAIEDIESYGCYEAWSESLDKRKADVCEVFSVPRVNQHVSGSGRLTKGKNYDLVLGDDLLQFSHRKRVREEIEKDDPFCVVLCPPCTMFSQMRRNMGDTESEKRKLREAIVLLNFAVEICEDRRKKGKFFLFEHPHGAKSWSCKRMQRLLEKPDVCAVVLDMCQYGMCDRVNGKPHKKSTRIVGNLQEDVMQGLHRRCKGDHEHQPLEGRVYFGGEWHNRTRLAQEYPDDFCRAVCSVIAKQHVLCVDGRHCEGLEVHAVEGLKEEDEKKLCETIRRAHQNLGHPGTERFVEMLRVAGASQKALEHAKRYKCSICEAQQGAKVQKVSKVRKTYEFNVGVCCDTFELEIGKRKIHGFSIICEGTNYHVVVPLWKGKTADETRRAYRRCWKSPFGAPVRLFTDGGGEFEGSFQEGLFLDGTADDRSAAYSPWQNSLIERHGQTWKNMFYKVCKSVVPTDNDEIEEVFEQVNVAKNTMVHKSGYSPNQRVFGKDPRLPGFVYGGGEESNVVVNSGFLAGDPSYVKSMEIRRAARKAFIEHDHEDRVRRAIEHRTRPERGPFIPGCKVYVWRPGNLKASGDRSYYWKGPGTVIGNSDSSRYWVSFGSKVLKCSPEQLRRLTDSDEAAVKLVPKELTEWRQVTSKRGVATFHDISKDPQPIELFQHADEEDYWEVNGLRMRRVHIQKRKKLYVPTVADNPPFDLDLLGNQRKTTVKRVADVDLTIHDDWRRDGEGEEREHEWNGYTDFTVRRTASMMQEDEEGNVRWVRPRLQDEEIGSEGDEPSTAGVDADEILGDQSTPDGAGSNLFEDEDAAVEEILQSPADQGLADQGQAGSSQGSRGNTYGPVRTTSLTAALRNDPGTLDGGKPYPTRPAVILDTLQAELAGGRWLKSKHRDWKIDWDNEVLIKKHDWRRTKYAPQRNECPIPLEWLKGRRQTLIREQEDDSFKIITDEDFRECQHSSSEKMGEWWSGYTIFDFMNPLDIETEEDVAEVNEVTLEEATMRRPDEWEGKKTEMEKLLKYQAARIIYPQEANAVRKSSCRILPSRFVITRKPDEKNPGRYITKARWCIRGYLDPDVNQLKTQAPTLSQEALALVLQLSASSGWDLNIGDVEGAFLQGDKLCRENGDLFVELPPRGAPGIPHGSLLKVEKAIYGLIDAPREWYDKLRRSLESIGFQRSKLDSCLYYVWENNS